MDSEKPKRRVVVVGSIGLSRLVDVAIKAGEIDFISMDEYNKLDTDKMSELMEITGPPIITEKEVKVILPQPPFYAKQIHKRKKGRS